MAEVVIEVYAPGQRVRIAVEHPDIATGDGTAPTTGALTALKEAVAKTEAALAS